MVWHFIGVYIINRTLHDRLEIRNFSSRVEKYFTRSLRSLVKYFSTLEEKFRISARPCNILYIFLADEKKTKQNKNMSMLIRSPTIPSGRIAHTSQGASFFYFFYFFHCFFFFATPCKQTGLHIFI